MKKILTANSEENFSGAVYEYRPDKKIDTVKDLIEFLQQLPSLRITIHDGRGTPREDVYILQDGLGTSLTADGKEILP